MRVRVRVLVKVSSEWQREAARAGLHRGVKDKVTAIGVGAKEVKWSGAGRREAVELGNWEPLTPKSWELGRRWGELGSKGVRGEL